MPSSFSNLAIMVLDVNFFSPYKTAGFIFFNDMEDAKKTDNSVVKDYLKVVRKTSDIMCLRK